MSGFGYNLPPANMSNKQYKAELNALYRRKNYKRKAKKAAGKLKRVEKKVKILSLSTGVNHQQIVGSHTPAAGVTMYEWNQSLLQPSTVEGAGANDRIGDKIMLKNINLKFFVVLNTQAIVSSIFFYRVVVVREKNVAEYAQGSMPQSEIFEDTAYPDVGNLRYDNFNGRTKQFELIWDSGLLTPKLQRDGIAGGSVVQKQFFKLKTLNIGKNKQLLYEGSTLPVRQRYRAFTIFRVNTLTDIQMLLVSNQSWSG